jgi:hypothetical protein
MMRKATVFVVLVSMVLTSCGANYILGNSAEVLDTRFPATLTHLHAPRHHHCDEQYGCWVVFDVRITNPTDRDAQVAQCLASLDTGAGAVRDVGWTLPGPPGGRWMDAGSALRLTAVQAPLLTSYGELSRLPSRVEGSCEGWDWHGHAPS